MQSLAILWYSACGSFNLFLMNLDGHSLKHFISALIGSLAITRIGWLAGWLVDWLAGWLAWLAGWLAWPEGWWAG